MLLVGFVDIVGSRGGVSMFVYLFPLCVKFNSLERVKLYNIKIYNVYVCMNFWSI